MTNDTTSDMPWIRTIEDVADAEPEEHGRQGEVQQRRSIHPDRVRRRERGVSILARTAARIGAVLIA